jgi:hypothetical protein
VKLKRIIALSLLIIVVLSTIGSGLVSSQRDGGFKPSLDQSPFSTQLIANIQDGSDEFRETAKVNGASESISSSETSKFINEVSLLTFKVIHVAQFNSYIQKQLLQRPSLKLYLDQRSLII